ncbi:hypothetical protein LR48_Vigan10g214100 [Vigna angularis]|uniref:Uncharacterized protein n=2 Tax=Phaseolus angularis TaxID=3914 RepID=A0A0L9VNB9_PHAAN|nr:uncharacterized protein At3g27210 [Vigna angularis]KOM56249.1 hypothetical protein LR48_Vigan10g214100 [Vigna angularis]BAU01543.1 hypothetical protein VIGAN_11079900 [Vigna angularis var. angularis]
MGSCSSVPRKANADMKLKLSLGSKSQRLVIPPSPIKGQPQNGDFKWSTTNFTDHGSKEEAFFDSKPWLDSDCEDDFYSVNGDFTPSRGTTPVHHTFGTPSRSRIPGSISVAETSPEKKKKLLELFRESVKDEKVDDCHGHKAVKPTTQHVMAKSANCTPFISGANSTCSSERTMSEDRASIREKPVKSSSWCIPSLSSCRSFRERSRKTSPAIELNGKH